MHLRRRNTGKKKRTKRAACMDEACRFASSSKKWETRERSGVFSIRGIWNRTRYNSSGENDAFVFAPSCDTSDFPRKILSRYNNFNFV